MTHNQRVLELLSDGEPHSHGEVYDLRVIGHSRVSALRKAGYVIECWRADGVYWYRLLGERVDCEAVALLEESDGQMALVAA